MQRIKIRRRGIVFSLCMACAAAGFGAGASAEQSYSYARHYVRGKVTRYTYVEENSGTPGHLIAVAKLTSYVHNGIGGERVRWISLTSPTGQDLSAEARAFPTYRLSLDPRAYKSLRLPKQPIPSNLQGPIDDLLTFFVGLTQKAGIEKLHRIGDSYLDPHPLVGHFSSPTAPVGRDYIQLRTTLTALTARRVTFKSSYQPPRHHALPPYRPFMRAPVCAGVANNFQLVQAQGTGYVALWGCESFVATTVVDRSSGQIISVRMVNPLHLNGRLCPTKALTDCSDLPTVHQERVVTLARAS